MHFTRFKLNLTEQIHEDRHQLRMEMVLRLFNPNQITAGFSEKRRHKGQHTQRTARGADLVYWELQTWFVLYEVHTVF